MHVLLHAGSLRGEPQYEPVHVEDTGNGVLRLLASPGLAYDVAAGDAIRVDAAGKYEVVERAGNLSVRVYSKRPIGDRLDDLVARMEGVQGVLDGRVTGGAVFTVPAQGRVSRVRRLMGEFVAVHRDCIWEFGNVYDEQGVPLEWCRDLLSA